MRIRLGLVVVAGLWAVVLPVPAQSLFARQETEEKGILLELEAYLATLSNGAFEFATAGVPAPPGPPPVGGGGAGGQIRSLDFGSETSTALTVGWSFGGDYGLVAARLWQMKADGVGEVGDPVRDFGAQDVGEILVPPTFFENRADAAGGEARVEITALDVQYGHAFGRSGRRMTGYWRAGLRFFKLEQDFSVDYFVFGSPLDLVHIQTEVDGIGPLVGLGGRLKIGSRVRLSGDIGVSHLLGSSDYRGEWIVDDLTLSVPITFTLEETGEDRGITQFEGSLGVAVRAWSRLEVEVGYRFHDFQNVMRRAGFIDDIALNVANFSDEDLTVDGPYLAVRWKGPFSR
jgi:hypothetical protein